MRRFIRSDPASFALSEQSLSNECWKESRGKADWVIVTDIDEHLFHPSMLDYPRVCAARRVTMIPALGFQIIGEDFPSEEDALCEAYPFGAPWAQLMKVSIFNPAQIEESWVSSRAPTGPTPIGNVRVPDRDERLLSHYKYLNIERTHVRHLDLAGRLGSKDLDNQWGHQYSWSLDELRADWRNVLANSVDIRKFGVDPVASYQIERWWGNIE